MTFHRTRKQFGPYDMITTHAGTHSFSIIPEMGARLNSLVINHQDLPLAVLDGYTELDELKTEYYSKSSLLAPFPNRIADGTYNFNDTSYTLAINKPDENNAIHGFVSNKPFAVHSEGEVDDQYQITLEQLSDGATGYPFAWKTIVVYRFSDTGVLTITTTVSNLSDTEIPIGFGWHPYFTFGADINNLQLQLPEANELLVDERLIPTGEKRTVSDWIEPRQIGETTFDTGFELLTNNKVIALSDPEKQVGLTIKLETGFDYVQVFTPPWRTSIAIEPMTCAANAFNNKAGLQTLAPEQSFSATFSISAFGG